MLHSGAQRAFQAHARHCWVALASAPPLFRNLSSLALPERAAKRLKVFSSSVCGPMPPVPLSVTVPAQPSMPLFESTFKIRPMTARDEALRAKAMDSDRKAAIKKWVSLITVAPNCWEVSRLTMQSAQPSDLTGGLLESVIDSFADKSNSTLHSRAGPLVRYVQFWNERGVTCFPVVEVQLYTFVKSLEDPAPTFPNSLLTSLRFAHFVLGLVIVGSAVDSGRIKGAAAAHYARKRQDARRPALTRLQLRRLRTPSSILAGGAMTGWLPDTFFSLSMAGSGTATARGSRQCTWTLTSSRIPMMVFLSVWQSGRRPRLVWLRSGRPCLLSFRFNLQGGAGSSNGWRFGARWAWLFQGRTSRSPFFPLRPQGAGGRACRYRSAKLQRG